MATENLKLSYTILCDDVRLEMGNKLSLMGIFQNVFVENVPVSLMKFAVVQHWRGAGNYQAEVRIMSPDKKRVIVASQPSPVDLKTGGFADNVSFFVNTVFPEAGNYFVQTLVDSSLFDEIELIVNTANSNPQQNNGDNEFPEMLN